MKKRKKTLSADDDYLGGQMTEIDALEKQIDDLQRQAAAATEQLSQKKKLLCFVSRQPNWEAVLAMAGRNPKVARNGRALAASAEKILAVPRVPLKADDLTQAMQQVLLVIYSFVQRKPRSKSDVTSIWKSLTLRGAFTPQAVGHAVRMLKARGCVTVVNRGGDIRKPDHDVTDLGKTLCRSLKRRTSLKEAS